MWKRVKAIAQAWGHYECASLVAGVAYYGALSLFPLMMVLVAGVGYFFRFMAKGASAKDEILALISKQISPEIAQSLSVVLSQVQDRALVNGPIAGVAFLFTASLVFAQIDRGFYRIWDVRKRAKQKGFWAAFKQMLSSRIRSLFMILGVCLLIVVMFIGGLAIRALGEMSSTHLTAIPSFVKNTSLIIGSVTNVFILTLLYRFLSKEPVTWRLCFIGSCIAAGLWELGSRGLAMLSFGSNLSVYGLIGSFLVVLLWIYYNVMVLFIGALFVRLEKKGRRRK